MGETVSVGRDVFERVAADAWDWYLVHDNGTRGLAVRVDTRRVAWCVGVEALSPDAVRYLRSQRLGVCSVFRIGPQHWIVCAGLHISLEDGRWAVSSGPDDGRGCTRDEAIEELAYAVWRPTVENRDDALAKARRIIARVAP